MLHTFLMIIHFFCATAIIALVLLQRGKGADAGAGFGAGASGTVFGARGASTALSRATAILAGIFMVTSLSLAYVGTRKSNVAPSGILDQFAQPAAPANKGPQITLGTPAPDAQSAIAPAPAATAPATTTPDTTTAPAPTTGPAPKTPAPN